MSDESDRLAPGTVSQSLEPITLYGSVISRGSLRTATVDITE